MFLRRKQSGRLNKPASSRSVFNGTLVILLSLCILLGLFGWKNAVAEDYSCCLEEHAHTDECYESTLICEDAEHEHTDDCITQTLICGKEKHTHTDDCLTSAEPEETIEQQEEETEENGIMAYALDDDSQISAQADSDVPSTIKGNTPPNTVVNLFDYWTTNSPTPEEIYPDNRFDGINKNGNNIRPLVFWYHSDNTYGLANLWTGESGDPRQGIVQNQLGEDGYPQINWDLSVHRDYWSPTYQTLPTLRESNTSLAYLFNSSSVDSDTNKTSGKKVYSNVDGLFRVDQDGYYYYDCMQNYAYFNGEKFELYEGTAGLGQFFPFADYKTALSIANSTQQNLLDPKLNHYFGLTMTTRFVQDHNGKISAGDDAKQMIFDFSGDDDVWIFVDDVLVSDLGGIHLKCGTRINFATGEVIYYNPVTFNADKYDKKEDQTTGVLGRTTLKDQFNKVYEKNNQTTVENGHNGWLKSGSDYIFANNTSHTLKFFYMERGNDQSNMKLTTNLTQIPETSVTKVDQNENPMGNVPLAIYKATASNETDSSTYYFVDDDGKLILPSSITNSMVDSTSGIIEGTATDNNKQSVTTKITPKRTGSTGSTTGEWIFADDDGVPYTSQDLIKDVVGSHQMIIREIQVPEGYRTVSDNILLYFDQGDHLTTPNAYESGVWPSPNVLVTASNTLYKASGNHDAIYYYDPTTGEPVGTLFAVVMKRNGAALGNFENDWWPVYGNDTSGYKTTTTKGLSAVLEAYLTNVNNQYSDPTFTKTVAGMQVYLTDMPGSLNRYYTYMLEHDEDNIDENDGGTEPQYCVCYYYANVNESDLKSLNLSEMTDSEIQDWVSQHLIRVVSHSGFIDDENGLNYEGFYLKWSSTIKITNIEDRLYYQKTDEQGNFVNGATFALYNAGEDNDGNYLIASDGMTRVYLGEDPDGDNKGTATINGTTGTSYDYTINSDGTITIGSYKVIPAVNADGDTLKGMTTSEEVNTYEDGTGRFDKLKDGNYILREVSAPAGYLLNTELVKVLVNEDGVYANAGKKDDGVIVGNGAGYLIPTFNYCASPGDIDETLTWIYSLLRINTEDNSYKAYNNLNVLYAPKDNSLDENHPWRYASAVDANAGGMSSSTTNIRSEAMVTYLQYNGNKSVTGTYILFDYTTNSDQSARSLFVQDSERQIDYSTEQGQNSLRLYTDEGWSELSILQDYAYGSEQTTTGNTTTYTNLTTQNAYGASNVNLNLTHLFSNSTFVRVADPKPVNVELKKVDSTGNSLTGAEFILYQQTGQDDNQNPIYQYYSYNETSNTTSWVDNQGSATKIEFKGQKQTIYQLTDGTYYLKETKAPSGYIIETEPWKMVLKDAALTKDEKTQYKTAVGKTIISLYEPGSTNVSQTATVYILPDGTNITYSQLGSDSRQLVLELKNTKIYNLPSSGSFGVLPFILAGSLILGFSVYLLIREERQEEA